MSLEQSFEICDEAKRLGLVVRYDTIEYRGETINFLSEPMGVECLHSGEGSCRPGLNNIYL